MLKNLIYEIRDHIANEITWVWQQNLCLQIETTVTYKKSHFLLKSVLLYLVEESIQKALYFATDYMVGLSDKLSNDLASRLQTICPLAFLF